MNNPVSSNTAERLVAALLTCFFIGFGWLTLLQGGVSLKGKSGQVAYASGGYAIGVAVGAFLFAALSVFLLAKTFSLRRRGVVFMLITVLVPPAAFLLLSR